MTQQILIYEASASGHRGYYTSLLAKELIRLGLDVALAMPDEELSSEEGRLTIGPLLDQLTCFPVEAANKLSGWKRAATCLEQISALARSIRPQHMYVPYADGISQVWGTRVFPGKLVPEETIMEGLMMRIMAAYKGKLISNLSRQVNARAVMRSGWDRLHLLDPLSYQWLSRRIAQPGKGQLCLLPEAIEPLPVCSREEAADVLGLRLDDRQLITCPGSVSERKGCDLLLRAFRDGNLAQSARLILLGKHSQGMASMLRQDYSQLVDRGDVISTDRLASRCEFDALFAVADVVATPYPKHAGSSSILIRAANAGKRVVASHWGWVGWATRNFAIGSTCNPSDTPAFSQALHETLARQVPFQNRNAALQEFLAYHSIENHLAHWTDLVCKRFGLPQTRTKKEFAFPPS